MRDLYWNMYTCIKDTERYYWHYKIHDQRIILGISLITAITSCASIASWVVWRELPWLWGAIVGISQIIAAINPFLPFSKRLSTIRYFIEGIEDLLLQIDHDWQIIGSMSDTEINDLILKYSRQSAELENKFIGDTYMPQNKKLMKLAEQERITYFFQKYDITDVKKMEVNI